MKTNNRQKNRILFCGGGTLGPVTPLLAVLRRMREVRPDLEFSWIGTAQGPEAPLVEGEGVGFHALPVAKVARYPDKSWFTFPFDYLKARKEAERLLKDIEPDAVFSAGGFMQVPIIRLASKMGIPCAIHQLDYTPLLSNKAVAGKCASLTASFDYPSPQFGGMKAIRVATPCRFANVPTPTRETAAIEFGLDSNGPIVFVTGGGTGAVSLNEAISGILDDLPEKTQIIHLTGKGKMGESLERDGYKPYEFFNETQMLNAYCASDLVVSRAGFGALSELAALGKPTITIPLPNSPQEENVRALGDSIVSVHQGTGFAENLKQQITRLLDDSSAREKLGRSLRQRLPTDDGRELAERWLGLLG